MTTTSSTEGPADPAASAPEPGSRRSSILVAAGIFLSRVFGFVRERAVSHFLGLGFAADAVAVAFRIPNLMQNLLGEGVLSASFIPVYARLLDDGEEREAGRVAGAVLGLLASTVGLVSLLAVVLADPLVAVITPGLAPGTHELAVTLTRITAPGIGLLVLSAWCLGVLNSHRQFFLSYVAPVLWNLAQIVAVTGAGVVLLDSVAAPGAADDATLVHLTIALAFGTLVGGALQLAVQVPGVRRLARHVRISLDTGREGVRRTLRAFVPIVTGRGAVQLLSFLNYAFASLLVGGALAALMKAQMLYVLPISLFGMSVAAAELPDLSSAHLEEREALQDRLQDGLERIAFYVLPTVVGFTVLGDLIVGALFRTGSFGRPDVILVWLILAGFCVGLMAATASRLLQSALYGAGDTRGPATLAVVRVAGGAALGLVLMLQLDRVVITDVGLQLMQGASLPAVGPLPEAVRAADGARNHLGAAGLSLGTGVFGWIEYRLLVELVAARAGVRVTIGGRAVRAIVVSAAVAAGVALAARVLVGGLHPIPATGIAVPVTGLAYVVSASRLGVHEADVLMGGTLRRLDPRG